MFFAFLSDAALAAARDLSLLSKVFPSLQIKMIYSFKCKSLKLKNQYRVSVFI
jgi:hypothetical protein